MIINHSKTIIDTNIKINNVFNILIPFINKGLNARFGKLIYRAKKYKNMPSFLIISEFDIKDIMGNAGFTISSNYNSIISNGDVEFSERFVPKLCSIILEFISKEIDNLLDEKYLDLLDKKSEIIIKKDNCELLIPLKFSGSLEEELFNSFLENIQKDIDSLIEDQITDRNTIDDLFYLGVDNKIKTNYEILNDMIINSIKTILANKKSDTVLTSSRQIDYLNNMLKEHEKYQKGK
ncbi:hypothetical protein Bp8pS_004 [Bacillus phage vB_BpuM-BpSp]|nr:hypothetical protein Bp8pS_004 [Bacillus phage vB_BpuM-BpSp]